MAKWLRQTDHDQEVVGSNLSTVYWMDVSNLLAIKFKKNLKCGTPKQISKE
jgi:hypothetical protein